MGRLVVVVVGRRVVVVGGAVGGVRPLPQTPHDLKNDINVAIEEV